MRKTLSLGAAIVAIAAALATAPAFAHGEAAHARHGAVAKEQKPWGIAGEAKAARRTIAIRMTDDMRFSPDRIEVREGETVRLAVHNDGRMPHELVIGTPKELDAHAELMRRFPDMEHDEPYMAHVKPGATGELAWNFNRAGEFQFACLIAGHYQAGMKGTVRVQSREKKR